MNCKLFLSLLLFLSTLSAQGATLTLDEISRGAFAAKGIYGVRPLMDGERYARMDGKQITAYSFRTGQQTDVLFDVKNTKGDATIESFSDYIMSPDEKTILIQTNRRAIYRHSATATYYIYNVQNRTLTPLSDGGPQEVPAFSRDGSMVAFVRDNNLFLVKLLFGNAEVQVTKDGKFNEIINGKPDWVNEEEFSFDRAFDFNADGTMMAWIRYDERQVPLFSFPLYRGGFPARDEFAEYPGQYTYKYPIAGAQNSTVTVHSYDIKSHRIQQMKLPLDKDGYVPRIRFTTSDPEKLLVLTQNRHQDRLEIYAANPRSTECKLIVRDQVAPYITEEPYKNLQLTDDGFVLMSERSGFNHLYLYDNNGTMKRQLTRGDFVVTSFYGYDAKTGDTFFASNEQGPQYKAVYRADAKGRVTCLTLDKGTNSAIFSRNYRYFMNTFSNVATPPVITLCDAKGKTLKTLENNESLVSRVKSLGLPVPEFFTFKTGEGVELNGYMVKPADFDASKKYPVILYQYSGPGSQQVLDQWNVGNMGGCMLERYLTEQGFICVCVDGRGTGGRGAQFEKQTYQNLGLLEAKDQVETALYMGSLPYVDKKHIGIWGWSYGGFMTLMSMTEGRGVFYAGVSVAPVTNYRFYDSVYTERFMRTPQENPKGYDCNPMSRASQLHGDLLICHGTADDNVHYRNTAELTEALVQADKPFMQLIYPNRNHSIYGGNTRLHLYRSLVRWFQEHLKE